MKVSLNWVKEFTSVDLPVDELVEKIGSQLGAIEEVVNLGQRYGGLHVVKVVSCQKHPDADKLSVCLVDDGGFAEGVDRNKDGLIQIVCGAPNVKPDMLAVWIPPGLTVPSTVDKDPLVLEAREIRGVMSNGMLASAKELGLGDNHDGILEIDEKLEPGLPFDELYGLDDRIIDIENKMFTHRPDCFGMLGVAREIAGITGQSFKSPSWYKPDASLPNDGRKNILKLRVNNQLPQLVPRFCSVAIKDVKIGPSPTWLQSYLARVGVRPINNIVDITNFIMLETAQPLHAYDYDKLKTGTLGVRLSNKGEQVKVIGGKTIELDQEAIVITDGSQPVGLGGVMGGAGTEVDNDTKNIILEAATFDMNATRRTAMAYGLFTDAATRFTKGQSPQQNMAAIVRASSLIQQLAGGRQASPAVDVKNTDSKLTRLEIETEFINQRLGLDLSAKQMGRLLENVEFKAELTGNSLKITAPFWRTDIEIPEDIVEEVGRLYGYDRLPLDLPKRDLKPAQVNQTIEFKAQLREVMKTAGANEVLTYSFVHSDLIKKTGQDSKYAYQISNALSPDLQYYRLSITPSLLEKINQNLRAEYSEFAIYELGKAHSNTEVDKNGLPKEFDRLAVVLAASDKSQMKVAGAPFYEAKKYVDYIFQKLGLQAEYQALEGIDLGEHELSRQMSAPYEPKHSAGLYIDKKLAGVIGEYRQAVSQIFKLPKFTAGFEIFLSALERPIVANYRPLNRFPDLEQDFCLRHAANQSYQELTSFLNDNLHKLSRSTGYQFAISPLDIYQPPNQKDYRQTTWRIILWHSERTLTTTESNKLLDELAGRAKNKLKAERI